MSPRSSGQSSSRHGTISRLGRRDGAPHLTASASTAATRGGPTRLSDHVSRGARTEDASPDDAAPAPARLLSVVELQGALRTARTPALVTVPVTSPRAPQPPTPTTGGLGSWVAVLGAHGGAGASMVALALADAAAAHHQAARLVSCTVPARSRLLAVTTAELGVSDDGLWRSGRRGRYLTVDRFNGPRHGTASRPGAEHARETSSFTVVDVDGDTEDAWLSLASAVVVVFRVTVPGVRHAERLLTELEQTVDQGVRQLLILGAAVGSGRWPGVVASSAGPLLQQRRTNGMVMAFPVDRQLEVTGLTSSPLPKAVLRAGQALLAELTPVMPATQLVATALQGSPLPAVVSLVPAAGTGPLPGGAPAKENCA